MKIATLMEAFDLDENEAKLARQILHYKVDPMTMPDRFPLTHEHYFYLDCDDYDTQNEMRLSALDELLGTCGVEAIRTTESIDGYHYDIRASYLNTGDSYVPTIVLDHREHVWRLISWSDFVESIDGSTDAEGNLIEVI